MLEIFLVEDDKQVTDVMMRYLSRCGYRVTHRDNGTQALQFIKERKISISLIILDLHLPGLSGFEICEKVRQAKLNNPILILTSAGDLASTVKALELGADDYLSKPFALAELLARCKALMRRPTLAGERQLRVGELEVNLDRREALYHSQPLDLRRQEFELLYYLLKNHNRSLSREQILDNAWSTDKDPNLSTVDVHVRMLRQKLGDKDKTLISTVHRYGYKLNVLE